MAGFASLADLAAREGWVIVKVAADGVMLGCSPSAEQMLRRFFPADRTAAGSLLPEPMAAWVRRIHGAAPELAARAAAPPLLHARGGAQLCAHFVPDPLSSRHGYLILRESRTALAVRQPAHPSLTRREREVLHWVALGKTNPDIGSILGASTRTVQKHMEHILQKLGVETRTAAARYAVVPDDQARDRLRESVAMVVPDSHPGPSRGI